MVEVGGGNAECNAGGSQGVCFQGRDGDVAMFSKRGEGVMTVVECNVC